jgi:hypothetical protein
MICPHCSKPFYKIEVEPPNDSRALEGVPFTIDENTGSITADEYDNTINWNHLYLEMYKDMISKYHPASGECPRCKRWVDITLDFVLTKSPLEDYGYL